ncbi:putative hemin ABC transporter, ATP-binding protein HmuV [Leptospira ryugenii]|uniref:Putative hemin ABC transporter, ATP-binding protein HmuV n=1 Tax=Leptospira ryugenii TaxID=1917863 RepID=A0A2P2E2B0_9LEPT|nr:heme ABC transporter ATP-binding protein [Leptospira ryugenii]GBF51032.1 putative hemin ABC transporter, ATP-binding protein HmuV [Leptospira ryugenii]
MIEVQNVSYSIRNKKILKNIHLEIKLGEVHVLLGKNGAGKTSLFKLLCGDIPLTEGKILFNRTDLKKYRKLDLSRMRSVMTQEFDLNFPFSVEEIVELGRYPFPNQRETTKQIVLETLAITDLLHMRSRAYSSLSGGEKQRNQYARVLAQVWDDQNKFIFLDEPISNMDLPNQVKTLELSKHMADKGYGVFLILHDLNLAFQYADRISLLKNGYIVRSDEVLSCLDETLLSEVYDLPLKIIQSENQAYIIPTNLHKEKRYEYSPC